MHDKSTSLHLTFGLIIVAVQHRKALKLTETETIGGKVEVKTNQNANAMNGSSSTQTVSSQKGKFFLSLSLFGIELYARPNIWIKRRKIFALWLNIEKL